MRNHDDPVVPSPIPPSLTWTVGAVAARLTVSASTLRTWERRYGLGPTERTAGGHRRYSELDIARVELLQRLISRGVAAGDAARAAKSYNGVDPPRLAALGAGATVDDPERMCEEIVDAAAHLDGARIEQIVARAIHEHGLVQAWDRYLVPALVRVGAEWARGSLGVEAEHLVSERMMTELRGHVRSRPNLDRTRGTVLLASAEDDQHSLPVFALEAALADHGIACHAFGARLPALSLANVVASIEPAVVFLWASIPRTASDQLWKVLTAVPKQTCVVVGGPGWAFDLAPSDDRWQPVRTIDLASTVDLVLDRIDQPSTGP